MKERSSLFHRSSNERLVRWLLMRHFLFTFLSALSLLLCFAMAALWVRSGWMGDTVAHFTLSSGWEKTPMPRHILSRKEQVKFASWNWVRAGSNGAWFKAVTASSDRSLLVITSHTEITPPRHGFAAKKLPGWSVDAEPLPASANRLAGWQNMIKFRAARNNGNRLGQQWHGLAVSVPHWFVVVLTGIPPALWVRQFHRRRRRIAEHQCVVCGYDLRATRDRCPECGTVPLMKEKMSDRPLPG